MPVILLLVLLLLLPHNLYAEGQGENLFRRKCTMCHVVNGKGGNIGPDLSRVAGSMTAEQLRMKIMYPKKSKPGSTMPSFATLPPDEMNALLGYIGRLR